MEGRGTQRALHPYSLLPSTTSLIPDFLIHGSTPAKCFPEHVSCPGKLSKAKEGCGKADLQLLSEATLRRLEKWRQPYGTRPSVCGLCSLLGRNSELNCRWPSLCPLRNLVPEILSVAELEGHSSFSYVLHCPLPLQCDRPHLHPDTVP